MFQLSVIRRLFLPPRRYVESRRDDYPTRVLIVWSNWCTGSGGARRVSTRGPRDRRTQARERVYRRLFQRSRVCFWLSNDQPHLSPLTPLCLMRSLIISPQLTFQAEDRFWLGSARIKTRVFIGPLACATVRRRLVMDGRFINNDKMLSVVLPSQSEGGNTVLESWRLPSDP